MRQVDEQSSEELEPWEYRILIAKLEKDNYDLKNQLSNRNHQILELRAGYKALNEKYKQLTQHRKPRYRNKGKKKI